MIASFYKKLQYLSIDISLGAVILLRFVSSSFEVKIQWPIYLLLALTVWIIYTFDHLRDAKQLENPLHQRYTFHKKHHRSLKYILMVCLVASGLLVVLIPYQVIIGGGILLVASLIYVGLTGWLAKIGVKELYVALIYTAGILVAPVTLTDTFDVVLFISLFLLSFLNLIIFSFFEKSIDEYHGFTSIAILIGNNRLEKLILTLLSLGLAITLMGLVQGIFFAIYFVIALLAYLGIILKPEWFRKKERFRLVGDGIFLLPILLT